MFKYNDLESYLFLMGRDYLINSDLLNETDFIIIECYSVLDPLEYKKCMYYGVPIFLIEKSTFEKHFNVSSGELPPRIEKYFSNTITASFTLRNKHSANVPFYTEDLPF